MKKRPVKRTAPVPRRRPLAAMIGDLQFRLDDKWTERVSGQLDQLLTQNQRILMALADLKATLAKIDTATDNIAADITALKAAIKPGMTDAEVAEVQASLDASAARLESIAASTDDPVPNV